MTRAKGYRKNERKETEHEKKTEPSEEYRKAMLESESTSEEEDPRCNMNGEQRKQDFNASVKRYEFLEEEEAEHAASTEYIDCGV